MVMVGMGLIITAGDRGRMQIPVQFRKQFGIDRGTKFEIITNDTLKLVLVKGDKK